MNVPNIHYAKVLNSLFQNEMNKKRLKIIVTQNLNMQYA